MPPGLGQAAGLDRARSVRRGCPVDLAAVLRALQLCPFSPGQVSAPAGRPTNLLGRATEHTGLKLLAMRDGETVVTCSPRHESRLTLSNSGLLRAGERFFFIAASFYS